MGPQETAQCLTPPLWLAKDLQQPCLCFGTIASTCDCELNLAPKGDVIDVLFLDSVDDAQFEDEGWDSSKGWSLGTDHFKVQVWHSALLSRAEILPEGPKRTSQSLPRPLVPRSNLSRKRGSGRQV